MAGRATLLRRFGWVLPLLVAAVVAALPALGLVGPYRERQILLAAIYAMVVAGFNVSFGYGGQLALGQVAVFAGGAYTAAILHSNGVHELLVAVPVAVAVSLLLGLVTGLPGIRFSDWSLALVAFFLVVLIPSLANLFESTTGGTIGLPGIDEPELAGIALSDGAFYVVTILVTALVLLLCRNVVRSRFGHGLLVVKQGTALTRSLGLSPSRLRLTAYVWAALPAGVAGVLYAYVSSFVQPNVFDFGLVTLLLAAALVGGPRSIWAAPVACFILVVGPDSAAAFDKYSVLAYGLFLVVAGVGLSGGLAGVASGAARRVAPPSRSAPAGSQEAPSTAADELVVPGAELRTSGLTKAFGGVQALDGVDFRAEPGHVTAIIGANGAGKTTLLNAISGLISVEHGDVLLDGRSIAGFPAEKVARAGVSRTFQTPQVPDTLTVLDVAASGTFGREPVSTASVAFRTGQYWRWRGSALARARGALAFVGLRGDADTLAKELPLGRRRILEVARCLTARPSVVMLDEPAAGLDPSALADLADVLRRLSGAGATVVLIEHNVTFVMDVADTVFVMELGRVIASGPPDVVRSDPQVIASYLGHRHSRPAAGLDETETETETNVEAKVEVVHG